jgi:sugar (pentulose or hexulose) kinase
MSYSHPVKPYWNLSGIISTTGKAIDWARELLGLIHYDDFFALAETAADTAEKPVFLPYLAGERAPIWNPQARGVIRNLSLSAGRPEFARAVLEGICFAIRDVISVIEEAGAAVNELRVAGAAAGSAALNRVKADVLGRNILIPVHKEAELLGLAIAGATALGKYSSLPEAAASLARIESRVEPDKRKADRYAELFAEYRKMSREWELKNRD